MIKLVNKYLTQINTLTLQNFTGGGVYNTYLKALTCKSFIKKFIYKIDT